MRKFSFLLLTLFFTACSDESTPSSNDPLNPSSYPDKISLSKPSLFIKDSALKGYLPYPIASNIDIDGYREEIQLKDKTTGINMEIGKTYIDISSIGLQIFDTNLFDGTEANINNPKFAGLNIDRFCMNYMLEKGHSGSNVYYKQISDTTFEKIGSHIYKENESQVESGESC